MWHLPVHKMSEAVKLVTINTFERMYSKSIYASGNECLSETLMLQRFIRPVTVHVTFEESLPEPQVFISHKDVRHLLWKWPMTDRVASSMSRTYWFIKETLPFHSVSSKDFGKRFLGCHIEVIPAAFRFKKNNRHVSIA